MSAVAVTVRIRRATRSAAPLPCRSALSRRLRLISWGRRRLPEALAGHSADPAAWRELALPQHRSRAVPREPHPHRELALWIASEPTASPRYRAGLGPRALRGPDYPAHSRSEK